MDNFNVAGLASGFDWAAMIDQLMAIERIPQQRLRDEQKANTEKSDALDILKTKIETLQSKVKELNSSDLFNTKKSEHSDDGLNIKATASTSALKGNFQIEVTKLATASKRLGTSDVGGGMGDALSTITGLNLATDITDGTFTINGQSINVAGANTLQEVFDEISIATSGVVTGSYDAVTDKVSLSSSSGQLELGGEGDSSNFLSALKLDQLEVGGGGAGTSIVSSRTALGVVDMADTIAASGLSGPVTGAGTFYVNGVAINFDADTESMSALVTKVNESAAGVTLSYDSVSDQFRMVNNETGGYAMDVIDSGNGIISAMGLTGAAIVGDDLEYTIDGGAPKSSRSNTITNQEHGIEGVIISAASLGKQTITIDADTGGLKGKIDAFISAFNDVQDYIGEKTKVEVADDNVTAAVLAGNRELSSLDSRLRSFAFKAVDGLASGGLFRLEHLGIDFISGTSKLEIKDSDALSEALEHNLPELESFFVEGDGSFSARMEDFLEGYMSNDGIMDTISSKYTSRNTAIDVQIAEMERRLEFKRAALESSFIAMEEAQSRLSNQSAALASLSLPE